VVRLSADDIHAEWRQWMMHDMLTEIFMNHGKSLVANLNPSCAWNKRRRDRFPIGKGIYALLSWKEQKNLVSLGHLIDINAEGCGIYYISDRSSSNTFQSQKGCKLRIISSCQMREFKNNIIVYDNELTEYSTDQISARRCGIKFEAGKIP